MGIKEMKKDSIYLGNCFIFSRNKTKDFNKLKERVTARLESWNGQLLSKAGKMTLIKSVIQAIPTCSMSMFKVLDGVCSTLDAVVRKFWWRNDQKSNKFFALKARRDICKPKEAGGLGLRLFSESNLALLAKLAWKLANGEDALWTRVMGAKYLKGKSFFQVSDTRGSSLTWPGILKARKLILKGARYKVGDGFSVNPWPDPWVPTIEGGVPKAWELYEW